MSKKNMKILLVSFLEFSLKLHLYPSKIWQEKAKKYLMTWSLQPLLLLKAWEFDDAERVGRERKANRIAAWKIEFKFLLIVYILSNNFFNNKFLEQADIDFRLK